MSRRGVDTSRFDELHEFMAVCHQDIGIEFPGWGAYVDRLIRERSKTRVRTTIQEIDALLGEDCTDKQLRDALGSLGAHALPFPARETLVSLRRHLDDAVSQMHLSRR